MYTLSGYSLRVLSAACLTSLNFGISLAALNPFKSELANRFNWCEGEEAHCSTQDSQFALVSMIVFVGAAVGSLTAGFSVEYFGRRISLMMCHLLFIIASVMMIVSTSTTMFVIGRILTGVAVAYTSIVPPLFISENSPIDVRGSRVTFHQLLITVGILIPTTVGVFNQFAISDSTTDETYLKHQIILSVVLLLPVIISGLGLIITYFCHETPTHLIANDNPSQAARILQLVLAKSDVANEMLDIERENDKLLTQRHGQKVGLFSLITEWDYLKPLIVGGVFASFQQISGINVFVSMSTDIIIQAGGTDAVAAIYTCVMGLVNFLTTISTACVVDKMGRRTILLLGTAGQTLSLLLVPIGTIPGISQLLGTASVYTTVSAVLGFVISFSFAYGPLYFVCISEMYSPEIRGMGMGISSFLNWATSALVVQWAGANWFNLTTTTQFVVFSIFSFLSFLWIYFFLAETRTNSHHLL